MSLDRTKRRPASFTSSQCQTTQYDASPNHSHHHRANDAARCFSESFASSQSQRRSTMLLRIIRIITVPMVQHDASPNHSHHHSANGAARCFSESFASSQCQWYSTMLLRIIRIITVPMVQHDASPNHSHHHSANGTARCFSEYFIRIITEPMVQHDASPNTSFASSQSQWCSTMLRIISSNVVTAPTARNMIARGKREAKRSASPLDRVNRFLFSAEGAK